MPKQQRVENQVCHLRKLLKGHVGHRAEGYHLGECVIDGKRVFVGCIGHSQAQYIRIHEPKLVEGLEPTTKVTVIHYRELP